ncbi:hypothetical protein [Streptomyces sp. NPDC003660]
MDQLVHFDLPLVRGRTALEMENKIERPDVVSDPETTESGQAGEMDRHRLQNDTSAAGLLDIGDKKIQIEGPWDRHGGHQALGLMPQMASYAPEPQLVESTVHGA